MKKTRLSSSFYSALFCIAMCGLFFLPSLQAQPAAVEAEAPKLVVNKKVLMTPGAVAKWNADRKAKALRNALKSGDLSGQNMNLVKEGAQILVLSMSLESERDNLPKLREEATRYLNNYARGRMKQLYIDAVILNAMKLVDREVEVRIQAALLIGSLNIEKANNTKKIPPRPDIKMVPPLVSLLTPKQPDAVKIAALQGLTRVARFGNAKVGTRYVITDAVVKELRLRKDHHWWLNREYVQTLSYTNVVYDSTVKKHPFVAMVLLETMRDPKMNFEVRSTAARALGQIKLDSVHNIDLIVNQVVQLNLEMAQVQKASPRNLVWRRNFANIYLCFHSFNQDEAQANKGLLKQMERPGLRADPKKVAKVKDGYQQVLVLYNGYLQNGTVSPQQIAQVSAWLKKEQDALVKKKAPHIWSVTPTAPAISHK